MGASAKNGLRWISKRGLKHYLQHKLFTTNAAERKNVTELVSNVASLDLVLTLKMWLFASLIPLYKDIKYTNAIRSSKIYSWLLKNMIRVRSLKPEENKKLYFIAFSQIILIHCFSFIFLVFVFWCLPKACEFILV